MNKKELRIKIKEQREQLTSEDILRKSSEIFEKLVILDEFTKAKRVFCYVSANHEVSTRDIIHHGIKTGKDLLAPKVLSKKEMGFFPFNSINSLKPGALNILEPEAVGEPVFPDKDDLIIVPGIAFDENKNRIGYGGGYYDRFINASESCPKIAIAFDFQIIEQIPVDEYDMPVDKIITEKRIID